MILEFHIRYFNRFHRIVKLFPLMSYKFVRLLAEMGSIFIEGLKCLLIWTFSFPGSFKILLESFKHFLATTVESYFY